MLTVDGVVVGSSDWVHVPWQDSEWWPVSRSEPVPGWSGDQPPLRKDHSGPLNQMTNL